MDVGTYCIIIYGPEYKTVFIKRHTRFSPIFVNRIFDDKTIRLVPWESFQEILLDAVFSFVVKHEIPPFKQNLNPYVMMCL